MNSNVCLLTELPESLHGALKTYLDRHPEWDQDRAIAAALSLFLMQNNNDGNAARVAYAVLHPFGEFDMVTITGNKVASGLCDSNDGPV